MCEWSELVTDDQVSVSAKVSSEAAADWVELERETQLCIADNA
jgi:hypothetical protein